MVRSKKNKSPKKKVYSSTPATPKVQVSNVYEAISAEDPWQCKLCEKIFTRKDAKMLECDRCCEHFCTKCLNKSDTEYEVLSNSDALWCCENCKVVVVRIIATDMDIEKRCNEIMRDIKERIDKLEVELADRPTEEEVRKMAREESEKATKRISEEHQTKLREEIQKSKQTKEEMRQLAREESEKTTKKAMKEKKEEDAKKMEEHQKNLKDEISKIKEEKSKDNNKTKEGLDKNDAHLLQEINDRKARENNIIIHGLEEKVTEDVEERRKHDAEKANKVMAACKVDAKIGEGITKTIRLGKFEKDKGKRPLLVVLEKADIKKEIFRNIKHLHQVEEFSKIGITNDLTKNEREQEQELRTRAKQMTEKSEEGEIYQVRGPPWARKIVKIQAKSQ